MTDIPGADERRREQERIRREYPDLYYVVVRVAAVAILVGIGFLLVSDQPGYRTNLFTELTSIAITVLIINFFAEKREQQRYKRDLIFRMGSQVNSEAIRAIEELRRHGWLQNGTLRNAHLENARLKNAPLTEADLAGAFLNDADLREAELAGANLKGADLTGAELDGANLMAAILTKANLRGAHLQGACIIFANLEGAQLDHAILPDGKRWHPGYDMSIFTNPPDSDASDG